MSCFADLNLFLGDNSGQNYQGIRSAIKREWIVRFMFRNFTGTTQ